MFTHLYKGVSVLINNSGNVHNGLLYLHLILHAGCIREEASRLPQEDHSCPGASTGGRGVSGGQADPMQLLHTHPTPAHPSHLLPCPHSSECACGMVKSTAVSRRFSATPAFHCLCDESTPPTPHTTIPLTHTHAHLGPHQSVPSPSLGWSSG